MGNSQNITPQTSSDAEKNNSNDFINVENLTPANIGFSSADISELKREHEYHYNSIKKLMWCMINQTHSQNKNIVNCVCDRKWNDISGNIKYWNLLYHINEGIYKYNPYAFSVLSLNAIVKFYELNNMSLEELSKVDGIKVPS